MPHITLKNRTNNSILFEGEYLSVQHCLESAINQNIPLAYINLRHQNLTNATLDCAFMPCADFGGANLMGANISEADLRSASFDNCDLYNTCLSFTNLENCDFRSASFGGTLINGANLQGCVFSTLSSFDLDFQNVDTMLGCTFTTIEGERCGMSRPPIVIKGLLNVPVVIFDDIIRIGARTFTKTSLPQFSCFLEYCTQKSLA